MSTDDVQLSEHDRALRTHTYICSNYLIRVRFQGGSWSTAQHEQKCFIVRRVQGEPMANISRGATRHSRKRTRKIKYHGAAWSTTKKPSKNKWYLANERKKTQLFVGRCGARWRSFWSFGSASLHSPRAAMHAWHSMAYTAVVDVMAGSFRNQP